MSIDRAPALTAEEARTVARFDAAPVPAEVVAAGERQEAMARAISDASDDLDPRDWADYLRDAAAAIAALEPSPAEEAVKLVEALAETAEAGQRRSPARMFGGEPFPATVPTKAIRAALASPAPAPQGEHRMLPGSHEQRGGPECRCGANWDRWNDRCDR